MHIRSKFDEGKQINRSQSGSWEGRCAGAGLRQVLGPTWGPDAWKNATGREANSTFRSISKQRGSQVATDRKRKASEAVQKRRKQTKYKKTNDNSHKARRDYARHDSGAGVMEAASDVPHDYLQTMMLDYYRANVDISDQKAQEIETITRGQGTTDDTTSNIWLVERRKHITASNTGAIAKRRLTTKVSNLVKSLLYSTFRGTTATEWGKLQEPETCKAYIEAKNSCSSGVSVKPSGLVVHPENHWLAASPDGIPVVTDISAADPTGTVEFKNPYKFRHMTLSEAAGAKDFCLSVGTNNSLKLKHSHQYYYQIQATMFCTKTKWCDFVVHTTVDLHVERIPWDPQFWMSILPKLHTFYFNAILPELALPRLHTGGIREPTEWLRDPKA